jgi:hypothetical protein
MFSYRKTKLIINIFFCTRRVEKVGWLGIEPNPLHEETKTQPLR